MISIFQKPTSSTKYSIETMSKLATVVYLFCQHDKITQQQNLVQCECNCRQKDTCPLEGKCLDKKLIYQCSLEREYYQWLSHYNSLTENTFKGRFFKHCNSFKHESKTNFTELSKSFLRNEKKRHQKLILALVSYWSCQAI